MRGFRKLSDAPTKREGDNWKGLSPFSIPFRLLKSLYGGKIECHTHGKIECYPTID